MSQTEPLLSGEDESGYTPPSLGDGGASVNPANGDNLSTDNSNAQAAFVGAAQYIIPELRDSQEYMAASVYLHEGLHYHPFNLHPRTAGQRKMYRYLMSTRHSVLEAVLSVVYLGIIVFEKPAVFLLPRLVTGILSIVCTCFFGYNLFLRTRVTGSLANYFAPKLGRNPQYKGDESETRKLSIGNCYRGLIVLLMLVSGALTCVLPLSRLPQPLAILRPLLVIETHVLAGVRRVLRQIAMSFWHLRWMLVLLQALILIFAILAYYFFKEATLGNFATLESSFINLFILVTTANYPDVMMGAFAMTGAAPVFFTLYLMLTLYFIMNIFLAMVYGFYQEREIVKAKALFLHRRRAVRMAFQQAGVSAESGLTMRAFREIMQLYDRSQSNMDVVLGFMLLDKDDKSGRLDLHEFYRFFEVVETEWQVDYEATLGRSYEYLPTIGFAPWRMHVRNIVQNPMFEWLVSAAIVANVAYIIAETIQSEDPTQVLHQDVQYVFYGLFLFEAVLKFIGLGVKGYFQDNWNRFDFMIIFISSVLFVVEEVEDVPTVGLFATVVRGLRLLRLLKLHSTFKQVFEVITYVLPKMSRFVVALVFVYYMFSVIGMMAFQDTVKNYICPGDVYKEPCPLGSYYYGPDDKNSLHFQLNGFDNILYSFNTLFILMVVNNWFVIMNGHVEVVGAAARIYFFVYFLVMVIIVSNIVIAFILDTFQALFTVRAEAGDGMAEKQLRVDIEVSAEIAKTFLQPDNEALLNTTIMFKGFKKSVAINDVLFKDEYLDWAQEDTEAEAQESASNI